MILFFRARSLLFQKKELYPLAYKAHRSLCVSRFLLSG